MFGKQVKEILNTVPSNVAYVLGVISGLAGVCVLGFFILLYLFLSGRGLNFNLSGGGALAPKVVAREPSAPLAPTAPSGPVEVKITNTDHVLGSSKAKVTIVEFSDFQCPFCQRFHPTLKQALTEYKDTVRLVYRHFPLDSIHPQARPAANAAECAAEQGKFWEYHDKLFVNQDKFNASYYPQLAGELRLNTAKFNECLSANKYQSKIDADYQSGIEAGVQGTPHSLVNGVPVSGAVPYEQLKAAIEAALKK